jgi:DNA-directed RNA polymerase sigma subunit (sigma70/sigma32)
MLTYPEVICQKSIYCFSSRLNCKREELRSSEGREQYVDNTGKKESLAESAKVETNTVADLRMQLKLLMREQVEANVIDERDARLLSLRLGLENGTCYTLIEASKVMDISPEYLRQRQHMALRKKIRNPQFFKLLMRYSRLVKLPRGVRGYL